jgi:hypothetical protein
MVNKLYVLKCSSLRKIYKTHYFLCLGEENLAHGILMKQFVNITSGTLVVLLFGKVMTLKRLK